MVVLLILLIACASRVWRVGIQPDQTSAGRWLVIYPVSGLVVCFKIHKKVFGHKFAFNTGCLLASPLRVPGLYDLLDESITKPSVWLGLVYLLFVAFKGTISVTLLGFPRHSRTGLRLPA